MGDSAGLTWEGDYRSETITHPLLKLLQAAGILGTTATANTNLDLES